MIDTSSSFEQGDANSGKKQRTLQSLHHSEVESTEITHTTEEEYFESSGIVEKALKSLLRCTKYFERVKRYRDAIKVLVKVDNSMPILHADTPLADALCLLHSKYGRKGVNLKVLDDMIRVALGVVKQQLPTHHYGTTQHEFLVNLINAADEELNQAAITGTTCPLCMTPTRENKSICAQLRKHDCCPDTFEKRHDSRSLPGYMYQTTCSATNSIIYKHKEYDLGDIPKLQSKQTCLINLQNKSHFVDAISKAADEDERMKLGKLFIILYGFLDRLYVSGDIDTVWSFNPTNLVGQKAKEAGIYMIRYTNGLGEIGMSAHCKARRVNKQNSLAEKNTQRAKRQKARKRKNGDSANKTKGRAQLKPKFAVSVMGPEEVELAVPSHIVEEIAQLKLWGIAGVHPDRTKERDLLISLQIAEMVYACSRDVVTNIIAERLFQLPSSKVRKAIDLERFGKLPPGALTFLRGIPDRGINCILTWPTLPFLLQDKSTDVNCQEADFLVHKLRRKPKEGGFVTLNCLIRLLGQKLGMHENVAECPRVAALDNVACRLLQILKSRSNNKEELENSLSPLQGENKSHYVNATEEEIAPGGKALLEKWLQILPRNEAVLMERTTFRAIKKIYHDEYQDLFDESTTIQLLPDGKLTFLKTRSGHRIIVVASYFTAFVPEGKNTTKNRFDTIHSYLCTQLVLYKSGLPDKAHFDTERARCCSFLMRLDCGGGINDANFYAFPPGYFRGRYRVGVVQCASKLQIGAPELLYIRLKLGQEYTDSLLRAHGLVFEGTSPLEIGGGFCSGRPQCGSVPAEPCNATMHLPLLAVSAPGHPLYHHLVCRHCYTKMRVSGRRFLEDKKKSGIQLTADESSLLNKFNGFLKRDRTYSRKYCSELKVRLGEDGFKAATRKKRPVEFPSRSRNKSNGKRIVTFHTWFKRRINEMTWQSIFVFASKP